MSFEENDWKFCSNSYSPWEKNSNEVQSNAHTDGEWPGTGQDFQLLKAVQAKLHWQCMWTSNFQCKHGAEAETWSVGIVGKLILGWQFGRRSHFKIEGNWDTFFLLKQIHMFSFTENNIFSTINKQIALLPTNWFGVSVTERLDMLVLMQK